MRSEKLEDLVVKLQPVNYAKARRTCSKLVKRLLSSRGSVNVDNRTNTLIIKDIPSVIHEVDGAGEGGRHADAAGHDRNQDRRGDVSNFSRSSGCDLGNGLQSPWRRTRPGGGHATVADRW